MAKDEPGPYLAGGFQGQVLVKGVDGSNRTFWTDASNLNVGFGGGADVENLEPISENRTYYVNRATGNDTLNNGRSPEFAFKTIQRAADQMATIFAGEFRGFISVADGTYDNGVILPNVLYSPRPSAQRDIPPFQITGNTSNRNAVIIDNTFTGSETMGISSFQVNGHWGIDGFKYKGANYPVIEVNKTGIARVGPFNVENTGAAMAKLFWVKGGSLYGVHAPPFIPMIIPGNWDYLIKVDEGGYAEFANGTNFQLSDNAVIGSTYDSAAVSVNRSSRAMLLATMFNLLVPATGVTGRKYFSANLADITPPGTGPLPGNMDGICTRGGTYGGIAPVTKVTAAQSLQPNMSGAVFSNEGAAALVPFTLENLQFDITGSIYDFYVQNAFGIEIRAFAGDTIRVGTAVTPAGGKITCLVPGSFVRLQSLNLIEWVATSVIGTWTAAA